MLGGGGGGSISNNLLNCFHVSVNQKKEELNFQTFFHQSGTSLHR
jgi:hypothetical protein